MVGRLDPPLVPRNGRTVKVILPVRVSDSRPGKQDERSLEDQEAMLRGLLAGYTDLPCIADVVAGSGSGENLGRAEYLRLCELVPSGQYALVLTEDVGRIVRRIHAHLFAELCVEHGVRLISINDRLDTGREGWQDSSFFAAWHHERSNRDTSERIKRAHRNRFDHGGCAAIPIAGIVKPPGSKSDAEWQKDPAAEPVYRDWFARLDNGASYAEIADWLNAIGFATGPSCRKTKWDTQLVSQVTHNPLLKGWRYRNKRKSRRNSQGKYVAIKAAPGETRWRHVPHLAFIEEAYYDRVVAKADARNAKFRRTDDPTADPLLHRPKRRTKFPGQTTFCGICGRQFVFGGHGQKDHLMCDGARKYACWMGTTVDGPLATRKILEAVFAEVATLPDFDEEFLEDVRSEAVRVDDDRQRRLADLDREIARRAREIENLLGFIRGGTASVSVGQDLQRVEAEHGRLVGERDELRARPTEAVVVPSIEELRALALEELQSLDVSSPEFLRTMQRLVPRIVVSPVRMFDAKTVELRARFRLRLARLLPNPRQQEVLAQPLERLLTVDLFDPPQRERFREQVVAMRRSGQSEGNAAAACGITATAAQNAAKLQRRMDERGVTTPWIDVLEPSDDLSRLTRHKHPRYHFDPLPGAGEV